MKSIRIHILALVLFSVGAVAQSVSETKRQVNDLLDNWHNAAATADFDSYFSYMAKNARYLGTDPSENWSKKAFKIYAKPYFDRGKSWTFIPINRTIYAGEDSKTIWFDELLDTQMGVCRSSGVVQYIDNQWKIEHYVLSISVPNAKTKAVIALKKTFDEKFIANYK